MKKRTISSRNLNPFLAKVRRDANKTELDKKEDEVRNFLASAAIACRRQISERSINLIPTKRLELENTELEIAAAYKRLADAKVTVPEDKTFKTYYNTIVTIEHGIQKLNTQSQLIQAEIARYEAEIVKLEETLEFLTA